jgi:hypothetical protein
MYWFTVNEPQDPCRRDADRMERDPGEQDPAGMGQSRDGVGSGGIAGVLVDWEMGEAGDWW